MARTDKMATSKNRLKWGKHGALKCAWEKHPSYELVHEIEVLELFESGALMHEKTYNVVTGDFEIQTGGTTDRGMSQAPFLTEPIVTVTGSVQAERYNPLDESLHRSFSQLKDADDCLGFARRHGLLGVGLIGRDANRVRWFCEPLNLWLSEASSFKFLIALNELQFEPDDVEYVQQLRLLCVEEALAQHEIGFPNAPALNQTLAVMMSTGGTSPCSSYEAEDLRRRAGVVIKRQVNQLLRNRVDFQVWDDDLRYVIVVRNLLASMTLSLVQQVTQKYGARGMCVRCDKPFQAIRSDAKFCSTRCRTAWSRMRAKARSSKNTEEKGS